MTLDDLRREQRFKRRLSGIEIPSHDPCIHQRRFISFPVRQNACNYRKKGQATPEQGNKETAASENAEDKKAGRQSRHNVPACHTGKCNN